MTDFEIRERQFEADIESFLTSPEGGYIKGFSKDFDPEKALCKEALVDFFKSTQEKGWKKLERAYGASVEEKVIERFCREVRSMGLLHVLRHGFKDRGVTLFPVFWRPETSMNETAKAQYGANVLTCTRQLYYSPNNNNSIDIVLFVNGIPVVSMELKCQFTGQDVGNAINQYKFDRAGKEEIFRFKQRVLVHFAVDLDCAYMTTRLQGPATYFIPFNQGSNGAGSVGGKGNPVNEGGYTTSYLWEKVLQRDSLLEILHKYVHLEQERDPKSGEVVSERIIFPRYHQLDVVRKLLADVRETGSGRNYLIQHSAGSGKSNSIAWLSHRLSGLHNAADEKVFDSVIVVTDRIVLDSQLQETIYQFDHVQGVVVKIDGDSGQLRDAINGGAGIVITTLQKFPRIYKDVQGMGKRFAVIVDEAHSSQSGKAALKLKSALMDKDAILEAWAEEEGEEVLDDEDKMLEALAEQGFHENLSFFAFTATPKPKTLQTFGVPFPKVDGKTGYRPYHVYSMRQAIEEGFILDVLKNYMTYKMYFKIAKEIPDDPELETTAGLRAIKRFEELHPHNIAQKTSVMLSHFQSVTKTKIGGRAKAMVVTASRLHAVRYFQEFKRQIGEKGLDGVDVLVAFSETVHDPDSGKSYTETGLNVDKEGKHIKESEVPSAFHSDDFDVLIVAEKYQTGFDEPLLHTMFVDKKLTDIKAVQTLSRLNRTMKGKADTFVLDFVNDAESIQESFAPFYEEAYLEEETDPNVIYDLQNTLDTYMVYQQSEVDAFADLFFKDDADENALGKLQGILKPALARFDSLDGDRKDVFRATLARFNRIYDFVTQVCRLFDKDIQRFSVYARFLHKALPREGAERVSVDGKISLEYYRLEKDFEGSIELVGAEEGFRPITGNAGRREPEYDSLSVLMNKINEQFNTEFTEMDKVLRQVEQDLEGEGCWGDVAKTNDLKTYESMLQRPFEDAAAKRWELNDQFFQKLFEEPELMDMVRSEVVRRMYYRARDGE